MVIRMVKRFPTNVLQYKTAQLQSDLANLKEQVHGWFNLPPGSANASGIADLLHDLSVNRAEILAISCLFRMQLDALFAQSRAHAIPLLRLALDQVVIRLATFVPDLVHNPR